MNIQKTTQQNGLTLLVTLLLMSVLLAITASLLNITIKQYQISGISRESEMAFQAANAGLECVRYYDVSVAAGNTFDVPDDESSIPRFENLTCMEATSDDLLIPTDPDRESGEEQKFQFDWGNPNLCTIVSIYKFTDADDPVPIEIDGQVVREDDCAPGFECTVIFSRGYNNSCSNLASTRTVERELTQVY